MNPYLGILLMAVGSACAASFYVPIKKVKNWSWETYWIVQGVASWILAPWIFAFITVPELGVIISETPTYAKLGAILFGALWGVGGLTFGLSMRYLGIALGQSIALGFCAAFGTLIPPIVSGQNLFATPQGIMMLIGVAVCIAGISIIGFAGALKSKKMTEEERRAAVKEFALKKGLLIAVLAGVMSACMNYGINGIPGVVEAGNIIQQIAKANGTNPLYVTNPALIFVMMGGFLTNVTYCLYLNKKNKTFSDYTSLDRGMLLNNIALSSLGGVLWFLQFFFFGVGQSMLPPEIFAFGWSILMALNIAFSNIWGIILEEWKGAGRTTMAVLVVGIVVLIFSTFVVNL